jgi:hypothetical protein
MDPGEVEFSCLVGWLRTFSLQAEVSCIQNASRIGRCNPDGFENPRLKNLTSYF